MASGTRKQHCPPKGQASDSQADGHAADDRARRGPGPEARNGELWLAGDSGDPPAWHDLGAVGGWRQVLPSALPRFQGITAAADVRLEDGHGRPDRAVCCRRDGVLREASPRREFGNAQAFA
jgi:hypothetical protein